ncbi:GlxA family transcriptional regulator [Pelagibius sp.]|uniref:GlxA family transcriptional regulator n=1 Tax=Pelagibius sp. TaxID=1931238 RepID=UPI003B5040CB
MLDLTPVEPLVSRHALTIVLPPDPVLFEFATAFSVFAIGARGRYRVRSCHAGPWPLQPHGAMMLGVEQGLAAVEAAQTVVVPGTMADLDRDFAAGLPPDLLAALRRAHARGCRIAALCTGSFMLAAAGLLDGRRATTHWKCVDAMTALFPGVRVEPNVLYVDEGDILTAAGVTAGIDLCLHMVRRDFGQALANEIARHMVFGPHRGGEYAQQIPCALGPARSCSLEPTRRWVLERLGRPITVPQMADHACLSVRAFSRRFHDEAGCPPLHWLAVQRLRLARQMLETSDLMVEEVALRCGFGSTLTLRKHFKRHFDATPQAYRRAFQERRRQRVLPSAA